MRGWLWPRAAHIWPELKSRYSLPLTSRTTEPRPHTMMGPVTTFLSMRLRKLNFRAISSNSASVNCCVIVSPPRLNNECVKVILLFQEWPV